MTFNDYFFTTCVKESYKNSTVKLNKPLINAVAKLAQDDGLKKDISLSVAKKFDGDYNVLLKDVNFKNSEVLESILAEYRMAGLYPQIYIPNFENKQKKVGSYASRSIIQSKISTPQMYIVDALDANDNQEYFDAYYLNSENKLEKANFKIDEEFANNNEVWVITNNERVNENGELYSSIASASDILSDSKQRVGTKSEFMMSIKCPDISAIEGWVKGALELRCIMKTGKGEITDQYFYPSRRRDINNKWWNPNGSEGRYLFYWDTETYAKSVLFTWIEVDDAGRSVEISGSFQYKDTNKETNTDDTANANYKFTIKSRDTQCGSISVHKDDGRVGDVYSTGKIDFITAYK